MKTLLILQRFAKALRWLLSATKPSDNVLSSLHLNKNGILVGTDGYRMHCLRFETFDPEAIVSAEDQDDKSAPALTSDTNISTWALSKMPEDMGGGLNVWVTDSKSNQFPDYAHNLPQPEQQIAAFAMDPKYLLDALRNFPDIGDHKLMFRVYSNQPKWLAVHGETSSLLTITNETDTALALIMGIVTPIESVKSRDYSAWEAQGHSGLAVSQTSKSDIIDSAS